MAILIGIDPSMRALGYSIFSYKSGSIDLIESDCFYFQRNSLPAEKLLSVYSFLYEKIAPFSGQSIYLFLETPFLNKNARTFRVLSEIRGVLLLLSSQFKAACFDVSPCEVKKFITSCGLSSKEDLSLHLSSLLNTTFSSLDASDSAGVALTGFHLFSPSAL